MALKVKKTEHAGAKNGGGHWGSRSEAKSGAKQRRRQESKRIISNAVKTESEAVTKSARAEINRRLKQVEIDHGVKIVYAVESGSRVWGFHSPDSDFDVRFLYIRPMAWYLSVRDRRDVIEVPIEDDFDLSGWDLQKALNLMSKSNPPLFEWFSSPIVYRTSLIAEQLRKLGQSYFNPRAAIYHYISIDVIGSRAAGNGRNIATDLPVRKGSGTRSDIDVRIDGQVDIDTRGGLSSDVGNVGNGAGTVASSTGLPSSPPVIKFRPGKPPERVT